MLKEVTILQKLYVSESEIIDLEAEVSNKSDLVVTHTENSHPYIYELKLKYLSREFKEQIISDIQKLYKIALKSELSQKRDEFAKLQKQYLKSIIQKLYKIALKSELSQKRDEFAKLQKQYLKSIK